MADPKNKWTRLANPPPPMFFGKKERDLVKQINDELAERVIGQSVAYYPISVEESTFNTYGEAIEKVSLPPIRVYAYVVVENNQTNTNYGYEYQTKLTVNFSSKRLTADQNLLVRVGDFIQYGDFFYEIVRTYDDTRYYFGQVEHKFQIAAECVRARDGVFRVEPALTRPGIAGAPQTTGDSPAPRAAPYPPLDATYITLTANTKLPYERVITAGAGITLTDGGAGGALTIAASGQNAIGPTGSLQFQTGAGAFSGSASLTYLSATTRLGVGTSVPTHNLTVVGNMSASSDLLVGGDLTVNGTVIGASPLKISGSIDIVDSAGATIITLGSSSLGPKVLSGSLGVVTNLTASGHVSASLYYGDGSNLTGITTTAAGANTQLQYNNSGQFGASANLIFNGSQFTVGAASHLSGGLIHKRTQVAAHYTASATDYILGVTAVPVSIEFDATAFADGQVVVIKDETGAAAIGNNILLNPAGSQTIDGVTSAQIQSAHGSVLLYSNGSNWFIY